MAEKPKIGDYERTKALPRPRFFRVFFVFLAILREA